MGSPSPWLGGAWILRHPVEIQAVSGAGGIGLRGRATACVERTDVGGGRVPTRLQPDLALFCRIPLAVARGGLDLATSGRDPSGFGGRVGRVVRRYDGLRRAHRRGRRVGFDPSSLGSRLILWDPPRRGSEGPGSRDIRSRSKRFRGPGGSGCAAVRRPAYSAPTWEKGGYRPVFARISPYFAGSSSPWLGGA